MNEMAKGIAMCLAAGTLTSLPVDLWGDTPSEAEELVTAVIDECHAMQLRLASVRIDPNSVRTMKPTDGRTIVYRDVPIEMDDGLSNRVVFTAALQ